MPFFDRDSKEKQPGPLERLRQYAPPAGPPPSESAAPAAPSPNAPRGLSSTP